MKNEESSNPNFLNDKMGKYLEKKAKKEGIRKGVLITAIMSFLLLVSAGIVVYSVYNREHNKQLNLMEMQKQSFTNKLTERDSLINDWVFTFDEIERNFRTIKEKENLIALNSSNKESPKDRKQQIIEEIKFINTLLDQNKSKIASLSAQLKQSGGAIKSLQNKIAELEASMVQRENEISEMKTALADKDFKIEQLNGRMTDMQVTILEKEEKISNQTGEMNKAFLISGTYKDLKEKGIVSKEGGFLGLGKKESLIGNFADSSFTRIDITEMKTIPVNSKSVKLITRHPSNSYELIQGTDKKIASIEIKDPDQFWKITKYAVVEIIN
jgi:peptidoglycan hydrolase CwlO-like protein